MFSAVGAADCGVDAVTAGGTSGALRRLAREDASEEVIVGAGATGTSVLFASGVTGAAVFWTDGACGFPAAGATRLISAGRG